MNIQPSSWQNLAFGMEEFFLGHTQDAVFLDDGDLGILGMFNQISAEQSSQPVAGSSCLAAQAKHLLFSIESYKRAIITGDYAYITEGWPDWAAEYVDQDTWSALREELVLQVGLFLDFFKTQKQTVVPALGMGALAHMAFHLGVIQVKYDVLQSAGANC